MSTGFVISIRTAMKPLEAKYSLQVISEAEELMCAEVLYANQSTGVRVTLDWRDFRPFVKLFQLQDGRLPPERPVSLTPKEPLRAFDADDLLLLRGATDSPVGRMIGRRDQVQAEHILRDYADALQTHAHDVLTGDFSVFRELNTVVQKRYADLHRQE